MTERRIEAAAGFDEFVSDRGGALWWAAWLLTGDAHHAEDLVQTALTKMYGRYASCENDRHFEAQVRTTIYRTFVSWWRRKAWRSEVPTEVHPDAIGVVDDDPALREDLLRALATLPRMQRAVLVLRYFEDRPAQEVAQMLGIPVGTVTSHASRGLKAMRLSTHLSDTEVDS
ncbi:SigE family RNA polymerase sigma factor [Tessaracoccus antarcticus]|uniref:SigE family RNA polymerase sigma factor n=1 Tax=Tessaracoccus antarcticus TaxID=2479848 RepID=A0A3M0GAP7_9ACTN|nr:SigE family RNA polymerase sigma factor [Tessaracoccus antarcticus]RMB62040.1 SigE family RNA polymerase sigma factor [Tessaracoccus antarcticus]